MTHEVIIWNGGGWNNYKALAELESLPRGHKSLMAKNHVAKIEIGPTDEERPLGISARYFGSDGEQLFHLHFDQHDSADWISDRVMALLQEGIQSRIVANAAKKAAAELQAAKAAGFETAAAHQSHLAEIENQERARRAAEIAAQEGADLAACGQMFNNLVIACSKYPLATRLTRAGKLVRDLSPNSVESYEQFSAGQIRAWLGSHGFRKTVDDRQHLFDAAKAHALK